MSKGFLKVNVAGYMKKWRIPATPGSVKIFAGVAEIITGLFAHHDIYLPELNIKGGAVLHALFGMDLNDVDISVNKQYLTELCKVLDPAKMYNFGKSRLSVNRISQIPICPEENINYVSISIKFPRNIVVEVEIVDDIEYKVDFDINTLKIKFSQIDRYGILMLTHKNLISLADFCEKKKMKCRLFGDAFYEKCAHDKFYCVQTLYRISKALAKRFKIANVSFNNPKNYCSICLSSPNDAEDDFDHRNISDLHMSKIYIHICDDAKHAICANCFYKFATGDAEKNCPLCRKPSTALSTTLAEPPVSINECISILRTHAPFSFVKEHGFNDTRMKEIYFREEFKQSIHILGTYLDPTRSGVATDDTVPTPNVATIPNVSGIRTSAVTGMPVVAETRRWRTNPYIF